MARCASGRFRAVGFGDQKTYNGSITKLLVGFSHFIQAGNKDEA